VETPAERVPVPNEALPQLLTDVLFASACRELHGSFLPMPASGPRQLDLSVIPPSSGGFYVERCTLGGNATHASLSLGGVAWEGQRRSHPSARFVAPIALSFDLSVEGPVGVYYDGLTGLVRLEIAAASPAQAHSGLIGPNTARPGGFLAHVFDLLGEFEPKARRETTQLAAKLLSERVSRGSTLFIDPASLERSLVEGTGLPMGFAPRRPFATRSWILNETLRLERGQVAIRGPFKPADRVFVEARVRAGGVAIAAEPHAGAARAVEALRRGGTSALSRLAASLATTPVAGGAVRLPPQSNPWMLVVVGQHADSDLDLLVRQGP